jgi:hypothetical protein
VRVISPNENRRELGHVPQLFRRARVAPGRRPFPIDFAFCPSPHRGCPILCDPRLCLTYSADSRRKGWGTRTSTLTFIPNTKCGFTNFQPSHSSLTQNVGAPSFAAHQSVMSARPAHSRKGWVYKISTPHAPPSIRILLHAQRTAQVLWRWRPPFHHL